MSLSNHVITLTTNASAEALVQLSDATDVGDDALANLRPVESSEFTVRGGVKFNEKGVIIPAGKKERTTATRCMWCSHDIPSELATPISIPVIKSSTNTDPIGIRAFCTFNCAAAYCEHNTQHISAKHSHMTLLNEEYNRVRGTVFENIKLAPSPLLLDVFGGDLSISEFRHYSDPEYANTYLAPCMYPVNNATYYTIEVTGYKFNSDRRSFNLYDATIINIFDNYIRNEHVK